MTELARLLKLSLVIPKEYHEYFRILLAEGISIELLEQMFREKHGKELR